MKLKQKLYCNTLSCKMGYAVKGMMRLLQKRFEDEGIDLTLEQYFILNILDNKEGLILQELAEIVHRDKSAVFRHIESLEENLFLARAADKEDKRRKILLVTKRGMKELDKARALDKQVNDDVTHHISAEKMDEFEKILSRIYKKAMKCRRLN